MKGRHCVEQVGDERGPPLHSRLPLGEGCLGVAQAHADAPACQGGNHFALRVLLGRQGHDPGVPVQARPVHGLQVARATQGADKVLLVGSLLLPVI